jgi:hypothetical protein
MRRISVRILLVLMGLCLAISMPALVNAGPLIDASADCDDFRASWMTDFGMTFDWTATLYRDGAEWDSDEGSVSAPPDQIGLYEISGTWEWDDPPECGTYNYQVKIEIVGPYGGLPTAEWVSDPFPCPCEPPLCSTDLIAGQDESAGVVTVSDDGTDLTVTFTGGGGWTLGETNLYVGTDLPEKAAPGKFPYEGEGDTQHTISLGDDLGVGCGDILYILAHAVVYRDSQSETAWADTYGIPFSGRGGGWAMYFQYEVCSGCIEP